MYIYVYICECMYASWNGRARQGTCICMYVCMYESPICVLARVFACMKVYIHIHVHIQVKTKKQENGFSILSGAGLNSFPGIKAPT